MSLFHKFLTAFRIRSKRNIMSITQRGSEEKGPKATENPTVQNEIERLFIDDEPTLEDRLGRGEYARAFARVAETCDTPFVVGLYGTWGVGKTSLMKLIDNALDKNKVRSLWFEPWRHQFDESPALALLHTVVETFGIDEGGRRLLMMIACAFGSMLLKASTNLNVKDIDELAKRYEQERFQVREARVRLRKHFEDLIEKVRVDGDKAKRLVFFIDDLDRCMPPQVLSMLEALKLYLNLPECVYFLGVDRQALQRSISFHYKELEISDASYIDKIVQLPFTIPPIEPRAMDEFVELLLSKELESCRELIIKGLSHNPRQIKRFINTLMLSHQLAMKTHIEIYDPRLLALLLLIQHHNLDLYRLLTREPIVLSRLKQETEETKPLRDEYLAEHEQLKQAVDIVTIPNELALMQYIYLTHVTTARPEHDTEAEVALQKFIVNIAFGEKDRGVAQLRGHGFPYESVEPFTVNPKAVSLLFEGSENIPRMLKGSQNIPHMPDWEKEFQDIGGLLTRALLLENYDLSKSLHELMGYVGGLQNAEIRFIVDARINPLVLEALHTKDKGYWMLSAPIYRSLRSTGYVQYPLFYDDETQTGPINCLIVEAGDAGYVQVKGDSKALEDLPSARKESQWLEGYLIENAERFRIGTIKRVRQLEHLHEDIERENWHLVHYAGHSYYDNEDRRGYLFLGSSNGGSLNAIDSSWFSATLRKAGTRFIYLSSSRASEVGLIFELASQGMPAVLGFRWDVEDDLAIEHVRVFYTYLFERKALEYALLDTRRVMHERYENNTIWAAAVLFLQVRTEEP